LSRALTRLGLETSLQERAAVVDQSPILMSILFGRSSEILACQRHQVFPMYAYAARELANTCDDKNNAGQVIYRLLRLESVKMLCRLPLMTAERLVQRS
jgi:hypothetical protein